MRALLPLEAVDSRKGAALACIYLIKDITEFRKSPVATCDGALFFNPKYK